ncbi:uncharacterized protein [Primulina huaijiensis]|uniref:uncharacterized protein n=1 Tax=Primulina huaijiensis TaxID=1492673 RepID=UPI003CC763E7
MNSHFQFHASSSSSPSLSDNEDETPINWMDDFENLDNTRNTILNIVAQDQQLIATYIIHEEQEVTHGGSISGHIVIHRDREIADLDEVKNHDIYFTQRSDSVRCLELSTIQKTTAALRILAYTLPADATDEYIKIGESTASQCMQRFCRAVVEVFAERYLRSPTANDVARLLYIGQYASRSGSPTIILEAVTDYDLWIWHAYFGMLGSNNDINVLVSSNLFSNIAQGIAPRAHYTIGGKEYDTGYYLADRIYLKWSTIVQSIHDPHGPKKKYFAMKQESCRKDVERAFGVLQSRFAIVASPARSWKKHHLHDIMAACIIMHNMIIEDECDLNASIEDMIEAPTLDVEMVVDENIIFQEFITRYKRIKDKDAHYALRNALIDHLWEEYSCSDV